MKINGYNIEFKSFDDIFKATYTDFDFKNTTIIFLGANGIESEDIDKYAEILLKAGCRSFAFYGEDEPQWHCAFDDMDIKLNGDSDEVALTWCLDNLENIKDEILICKPHIVIYAYDQMLIQRLVDALVPKNEQQKRV